MIAIGSIFSLLYLTFKLCLNGLRNMAPILLPSIPKKSNPNIPYEYWIFLKLQYVIYKILDLF